MANPTLRFPEGFLWGASTSAHQVEGNNTNSDWWAWEHSKKRMDALTKQGLNPTDFQSNDAADHFNRYRADTDLIKKLNLNAYRFSLEWARIEPEEGNFDIKAIMHYAEKIEALKKRGIEPIVTLHHQTNPNWFTKKYGWQHWRAPELFGRYAEHIAQTLGTQATWWLTINEPKLAVLRNGPAKIYNPISLLLALRHLISAHQRAYDALHRANPEAQVSIPYNFQAWSANDFYSVDEFLIRTARRLDHGWFLGKIKNQLDYIGVNYYTAYRFSFRRGLPAWRQHGGGIVSDMGWEIYPEGLYHILHELGQQYDLPIIITENGIADASDSRRAYFISKHLEAVHRAIGNGADVRGYCYWSLMDNFEWAHGFEPRFGLIEIDYKTQKRTIRASANHYANIAKTNTLKLTE